ncbi:MAG: hypothetical protein ACLVCR_08765, partial [Lachnospiraceae bacterium]
MVRQGAKRYLTDVNPSHPNFIDSKRGFSSDELKMKSPSFNIQFLLSPPASPFQTDASARRFPKHN